MHKTAIIAVSALCMLASARVASAQTGYAEAEIGESTINIECVFNQPDFKEKLYDAGISSPDFICDFFVLDNALYFSMRVMTRPDEQKYQLIRLQNQPDGTWRYSVVDIDWNGQTPPALGTRCAIVGTDSEGAPYFAAPQEGSGCPLKIYPLEFSASGNPTAMTCYIVNSSENMYTKEVSVFGNLKSGNFSVAALSWFTENAYRSNLDAAISYYDFSNGALKTELSDTSLKAYNPTIQNLGSGRILIQDTDDSTDSDYQFSLPTVCTINSQWLTAESTIPQPDYPVKDSGACIFSIDGEYMMIYRSDVQNADKYQIDHLPQYPYSIIEQSPLWHLTEDFNTKAEFVTDCEAPTRTVVNKTGKSTELYLLTNNSGLACYRLTAKAGTVTGMATNIGTKQVTVEYYNLTGMPVLDGYKGIVIERRSDGSSRLVRR